MRGGTPAAEQGRPHGGRAELGRPQVGDGGGQDLPVRAAGAARGDACGAPEQSEEIAAVGFVAHGPQRVNGGLEHGGITGLLHRCRRVEGEVLALPHARDPTGGDDGA